MLLLALKDIPGSMQIAPGQTFFEPNDDQRAIWLAQGYAKPANEAVMARDNSLDWTGSKVVIIASGPSLTTEQCAAVERWKVTPAKAPTRRVIVINTSFRLAPFADILYACDGAWWTKYYDEASVIFRQSQMWTQDEPASRKFNLRYIKSAAGNGLSRKPGLIHQGMNSAYQSINLAYLLGARDFVLLGVDCRGTHWHGDHPAPLNRALPHKQWIDRFRVLSRDLEADGAEVVNCSPGTALGTFRLGTLDAELAR